MAVRFERKHLYSGVAVVAVFLFCVAYILTSVLRLPLFGSGPVIQVQLPETGGLYAGANASYRGNVVGKVTSIVLTPTGVEATVRLDHDVRIPADAKVKVRSLSPVGEQYLDFEPSSGQGPYLADGDTVDASAVGVPTTVAETSASLSRLLDSVNPRKLRSVLVEAGRGLEGNEDAIQQLLADTADLAADYDGALPSITSLLRNGDTVLTAGDQTADDLLSFTHSAKLFAAWLHAYAPTLFADMRRQPGQLKAFRLLLSDLRQYAPAALDEFVTLGDLFVSHDPHLRALLQTYPGVMAALGETIQGNSLALDLILRRTPLCDYGAVERSPKDVSFRALLDDGHCSTSLTDTQQRGAQFAPGPVAP